MPSFKRRLELPDIPGAAALGLAGDEEPNAPLLRWQDGRAWSLNGIRQRLFDYARSARVDLRAVHRLHAVRC